MFILIFFSAFFMRYESAKKTVIHNPLVADAGNYFMYAFNLKYKHTYSLQTGTLSDKNSSVKPDAVRYPGYPLFLALIVDGIPDHRQIKKIAYAQMIISMLTLLISFLFLRNCLPMTGNLIACAFIALSPHLIVANSYILTETLFCFVLSILGYVACLFFSNPSLYRAGLIGIVLGVLNLIRPSLQYFLLLIPAYVIFIYGKRKGIKLFSVIILCFSITYSPWIIRNMITLGQASNTERMAMFLQHGMYPDFMYQNMPDTYGSPYKYDPDSKKFNKNTIAVLKEIKHRFQKEPIRYLVWYLFKKPFSLWSWNMVQGQGDAFIYPVTSSPYMDNATFLWTNRLMYALHWPVVLLCLLSCICIWIPRYTVTIEERTIKCIKFISILLLYYTGIHIIGVPLPRYSVPFRPFLYGMAIFSIYLFFEFFKSEYNKFNP